MLSLPVPKEFRGTGNDIGDQASRVLGPETLPTAGGGATIVRHAGREAREIRQRATP